MTHTNHPAQRVARSPRPTRTLLKIGKREIFAWSWAYRSQWTLWPERSTMWSGKLIYWQWGPFTLHTDNRGGTLGILSDMTGKSREELAAKLQQGDSGEATKETSE